MMDDARRVDAAVRDDDDDGAWRGAEGRGVAWRGVALRA